MGYSLQERGPIESFRILLKIHFTSDHVYLLKTKSFLVGQMSLNASVEMLFVL
jgi:hypothetical protein